MDEAQKYKQRLEAIAEKRRLQEEQDKTRREMEDEKLRQQQLKRKSLREQWLMEGPPLSPTSPTTQNLLSSLWSTQDMEEPSDTLQSENQRLAEELETLEEQKAVKVTDPAAEKVPTSLQNGENKAAASETSDEVELIQSPPQVEKAAVLTNGGHTDPNSNHITSEHSELNPNGPVRVIEGVNGIKLESEISVAESASAPNVNINEEEEEEEEEEGILVMRAEPVFITDDGDDGSEDLPSQRDQLESDKTPLPHPEAGNEIGEDMEQVVESEPAPDTLLEPENHEATELTVEGQEITGDEDKECGVKMNNSADEETAEVQDKKVEDPVCVQLQAPVSALEGAMVALVPVYTETSPSALSHNPRTNDEASAAPEEEEEALKVEDPICQPDPFQEVPLTDPQENQSTKMEPREQEPLLVKVEASNVYVESARSNSPVNAETQNQTKTSRGEEAGSPKRKTCQCCTIM